MRNALFYSCDLVLLVTGKTLVSFSFLFSSGGGLEGSDLRRCPLDPSLFSSENNDGSSGHQAHLVRSKQDGVGTLPMLRLAGGDVLRRSCLISTRKQKRFCCSFVFFVENIYNTDVTPERL